MIKRNLRLTTTRTAAAAIVFNANCGEYSSVFSDLSFPLYVVFKDSDLKKMFLINRSSTFLKNLDLVCFLLIFKGNESDLHVSSVCKDQAGHCGSLIIKKMPRFL